MKKYFLLIFASSCLTCDIAFCSKLPDDIQTLFMNDFTGGLFTNSPRIPYNFSKNMKNVFIDNGKIEKVKGFIVAGSSNMFFSGLGITGIFPFYSETGQTSFLVTDSSVILDTADFTTWVFVSSGLNSALLTQCIQVQNKMWCGNGSDPWITWDRTTKVVLDGSGTTPNVPRFKYPAYWQNRVWGLNKTADGSSLDFCSLKSTDGIQIAPDDSRAWPSTNNLSVGKGDGQIGSGIWIYNGQLKVGKERSIYTIYGTNASTYQDRKDNVGVGVLSHDSIRVLDGNSYFVGQDGIYENGTRISDRINPDFLTFQKGVVRTVQNLWETQSDFSKGDFRTGSTGTSSGFLTIVNVDTFVVIDNVVADSVDPGSITFTSAQTSYISTFTVAAPHSLRAFVGADGVGIGDIVYSNQSNFRLVGSRDAGCASTSNTKWTITNLRSGKSTSRAESGGFTVGNGSVLNFSFTLSDRIFFDGDDIAQSSMAVKIEAFPQAGCNWYIKFPTNAAKVVLTMATTAQFISEVSTLNTVTAWGNFDSVRNTNGGAVTFFTRTSTSSVNIATQVWVAQAPGSRINAPTINNYIQWASTISSVSTITTTNIDNVTIGHIEGAGAVNRPFAETWDNRLWLSVSTESSGKFSRIYVKSRITNPNKDAWMPIEGINIRSFARDGTNTLYGGAASTNTVYRLDYGTNFNGQAIESIYQISDLVMDSPYKNKMIQKYLIEGAKETGGNVLIGTSSEDGDITESTLSTDGSGTYREVIEGITNSGTKSLNIRFRNNQLDKGMTINSFGILWVPTGVYK